MARKTVCYQLRNDEKHHLIYNINLKPKKKTSYIMILNAKQKEIDTIHLYTITSTTRVCEEYLAETNI